MIDPTFAPSLAILRLEGYNRNWVSIWEVVAGIFLLVSILALGKAFLLFWKWWNGPITSPKRLFRALCEQHGLTALERNILKQIAHEGEHDPSFLFIDPELWQDTFGGRDADGQRHALYRKLFGVHDAQV